MQRWGFRSCTQLRSFTSALPAALRSQVDALLASHQICSNPTQLEAHGRDESYHHGVPPQLVTYPETTQQVSALMKLCHRTATPVIPFGSGTSLEGHIAALHGGICLDLSRMTKIIEVALIHRSQLREWRREQIFEADFCCRAEAGVTRKSLNAALRSTGLFFSVDPGADATLGGMVGTRASGTNTVKYGTMRDNLLGCTAVLANGDIIKTGSKAVKSSAGYDLTHLLCGSEGTLAVVTEVLVKLHPHPECISAAVCEFPSMQAAVDSATAVIQNGIPVSRMELLDALSIASVNEYSHTSLTPCPTLFFEFHGSSAGVKEQSERVAEIVRDFEGSEFQWETTPEGRSNLWKARHTAYWATLQSYPNCRGYITDVCVPISHLADAIVHAQTLAEENGIPAPIVGHVGDGNFHSLLMVREDDAAQLKRAKDISDAIVQHALRCGGTCTGEHGVGHGKLGYLEREHGTEAVETMRLIKHALDPRGILNPGKLGSRV